MAYRRVPVWWRRHRSEKARGEKKRQATAAAGRVLWPPDHVTTCRPDTCQCNTRMEAWRHERCSHWSRRQQRGKRPRAYTTCIPEELAARQGSVRHAALRHLQRGPCLRCPWRPESVGGGGRHDAASARRVVARPPCLPSLVSRSRPAQLRRRRVRRAEFRAECVRGQSPKTHRTLCPQPTARFAECSFSSVKSGRARAKRAGRARQGAGGSTWSRKRACGSSRSPAAPSRRALSLRPACAPCSSFLPPAPCSASLASSPSSSLLPPVCACAHVRARACVGVDGKGGCVSTDVECMGQASRERSVPGVQRTRGKRGREERERGREDGASPAVRKREGRGRERVERRSKRVDMSGEAFGPAAHSFFAEHRLFRLLLLDVRTEGGGL